MMVDVEYLRRLAILQDKEARGAISEALTQAADEIEALRKGDGYAKAKEDSAAKAESMAPVTSNHAAYTIAAAIRALAGKDAGNSPFPA